MRYEVSYRISTHDDDGPTTERRQFGAADDQSARRKGNRIAHDRVERITRAGGVAAVDSIEVRRVYETFADPI